MSIGFYQPSQLGHPQPVRRAIYAVQAARKIGYVQHEPSGIWFCDTSGRKLGRVLRYKPDQSPGAYACACSGSFLPNAPINTIDPDRLKLRLR